MALKNITATIEQKKIEVTMTGSGLTYAQALVYFYNRDDVDALLENYALATHNHDDRYYTEAEVNSIVAGKSDVGHIHDDRYFTESEVTTLLAGKSNTGHSHNDLYYTEAEVDAEIATLEASIATKEPAITGGANTTYFRGDKTFQTLNTTVVPEGSNLYFTQGRFDTAFDAKDTDDLGEGTTNLYHTDERVDARITAQKGQANGIATLDSNSKIPTSQLPALAISDTFVVANESAMLALDAQVGDIAIRTDQNKSYILDTADPTILANWQELLTPTDSVTSVNGQTGAVNLTTSNINEGSNLYYTQSRFNTAFSAKSTTDLAEGSNLYFTNARFDARFSTQFSTMDTDDLTEGATNKYFTDERVDDRVASLLVAGTGITKSYNDGDGTLTIATTITQYTDEMVDDRVNSLIVAGAGITKAYDDVANTLTLGLDIDTDDVPEGTGNLYWTNTRFDTRFATAWGEKSTTDLPEGTNLYYTNERVDDRVASLLVAGSNVTLDYNDVSNTLTINASLEGGANALDDLSDVVITTPADGHIIQHNGTNFVNVTLADAGISELGHSHDDLYFTEAEVTTLLAGKSDTGHTHTASNVTDFSEAVDDRVSGLIQNGTGISFSYNDAGGTLTPTITLAPFDTDDLGEGSTNLYYTNARADARISAQKGVADGLATLGSDGKVPSSQLPAIAITDTFVVGSQASMLALSAETGDIAVRTDLNKTFILDGSDPTVLANWQELLTPTDAVTSVNGQTGVVSLSTTNIGEGTNLYFTNARVQTVGDARYLQKTNNLSDLDNASTARTNLGVAIGSQVQAYNAQLASLASLATNGIVARTASNTVTARTITGTSNQVTVTNGNGVSGNPTLSLPQNIHTGATPTFAGLTIGTLSGVLKASSGVVAGSATTTDLTEGTNLYFTDERVDDRVNALIVAGLGLYKTYDDGANTLTLSANKVVALTDGANIATDASLGDEYRVTLGGNRTLDNPTNAVDGKKITWRFKQDGTGNRTITLGNKFRLGADITAITLSTTANKVDYMGAVYNSTDDKWDVIAFVKGY